MHTPVWNTRPRCPAVTVESVAPLGVCSMSEVSGNTECLLGTQEAQTGQDTADKGKAVGTSH